MGWIAVEKEFGDPAFYEALKGHTDDWKLRAIAGYVMRSFCDDVGIRGDHDLYRKQGLSRCYLPEQREAWLFGFDWPDRKGADSLDDITCADHSPGGHCPSCD